jgi:hypothetical protein
MFRKFKLKRLFKNKIFPFGKYEYETVPFITNNKRWMVYLPEKKVLLNVDKKTDIVKKVYCG